MPDQDKGQKPESTGKVNIEKPGSPRIDPTERGRPATGAGGGRPMDKDRPSDLTEAEDRRADADMDRPSPSDREDAGRQAGQEDFPDAPDGPAEGDERDADDITGAEDTKAM